MSSLFRFGRRRWTLCRALTAAGSKQAEDNSGVFRDPGERGFSTRPNLSLEQLSVGPGDTADLLRKVLPGIRDASKTFAIPALKQVFEDSIRPLLVTKCLLIHQPLDKSMKTFNQRTNNLLKKSPRYLSALDVTTEKEILLEDEWTLFLEHIFKHRVIVVDDWTKCYGTVQTFLHSSDAESCSDSFKGECDASFCEQTGKAKLAFVIFKEGKLVWAEVFHEVPCKSVMEAEALAVIALLFKLIDLNLLRGTVWTDNMVCYNVLNGEYEIKVDDPNRSLFLFLRSLRGRFESLTTVWKPRELLLIPDRLVSMVDDPLISRNRLVLSILEKTVSILSQPQFRISWSSYLRKIFDKRDGGKQNSNTTNEIKESDESEDSICWVKADDEEAEIASFLEIMKTFSAHRLLIVVDKFEDKSPHYQKLIQDLSEKFHKCWMSKQGSVTIMRGDSCNTEEKETKRLVVMFGGTMALDEYIHQQDLCTVVLVKTAEINLLRDAGIKEISAKTLLSFRNIKAKPVVPKKPREDEDLEKGVGGEGRW
uniref:RNase H type-1 domain-containing protein n=1 Tax=Oryza meridionalis TaxID=40149 RepID=A0A0E0CCV4_9ORYZ